jgi:hypothetical protein
MIFFIREKDKDKEKEKETEKEEVEVKTHGLFSPCILVSSFAFLKSNSGFQSAWSFHSLKFLHDMH